MNKSSPRSCGIAPGPSIATLPTLRGPGFRTNSTEVTAHDATALHNLCVTADLAESGPTLSRWRPSAARVAAGGVVVGLLAWWGFGQPIDASPRAVIYVICALVGIVSGLLSGLLGIGGALVTVPALYVLLPQLGVTEGRLAHAVVATALVAMVPTAMGAAWSQHRRGALVWRWLLRLAPCMVIGGGLGALLALQMRGVELSLLFAAQSVYYGINLLRAAPVPGSARARIALACRAVPMWLATSAIAAFSSCVGMGAGSLLVPYLAERELPLRQAVATACALNLCLAVSAAWVLVIAPALRTGGAGEMLICWVPALVIGLAACMAAPVGVALAHAMPLSVFRRLLGAITLLGAAVLTGRALAG